MAKLESLINACMEHRFIASDVVIDLFLQDESNYKTLMKIVADYKI